MSANPFDPDFRELPREIPVFPLPGALLLPRCDLPLNIFEPRYLTMTLDALAADRMIGMVQPLEDPEGPDPPEVYRTGGAGRITSFRETDDGRFLITLRGVCRFHIVEELAVDSPYRRVIADWSAFEADLRPSPPTIDRERLTTALERYFDVLDIDADWEAVESTADAQLVDSLAMICPFDTDEKQALLQAEDASARCRILVDLLEMAVLEAELGVSTRQ